MHDVDFRVEHRIAQNPMKLTTDGVTPRVNDSTVRVAAFEAQCSRVESSAESGEIRDRARRRRH